MKTPPIDFVFHDGGRAAAGYKGSAGDCFVRAVAIAMRRDYQEVYDEVLLVGKSDKLSARRSRKSHPRTGVYRSTADRFLAAYGAVWVPTMAIGTGCRVHLCAAELPPGRLIVRVSRHYAAVIDRTLYDTHDSSRYGTRCVYGYWRLTRVFSRKLRP